MYEGGNSFTRRGVLKKGVLATGALVLGSAASGSATAGIGDGRIGHYNLNNLHLNKNTDEKIKNFVHDASTYKNHGTNEGAELVKDGAVGNAFKFDGDDDYVVVPDDDSLDLQDELTISFWFKLEGESGDNQYPRPVSKGQSTTTNGAYSVYVEDPGGDPTRIGLRFIDTDGNTHDVNTGNTLPNYDDDMWHHVVATYSDPDDVGRLWFDGTKEVDKTFSDDIRIRTTDDDLHLGDGNNDRHLNGKLDEVRIHNRALSEDEVQELVKMKD